MESINTQVRKKIVIKAGGSILAREESFQSVAASIMSYLGTYDLIFVVVSAPTGITNMITTLLDCHDDSEREMIINRMINVLRSAGCDRKREDFIIGNIRTYSSLFNRTGNRRYSDLALIQGELFSSEQLASTLIENGSNNVKIIDPATFLHFKSGPNKELIFDEVKSKSSFQSIIKIIEDYRILIVPGFYGINGNGKIITIGRGGSDLTASLVSILTQADKLEFWKDVNGIYSMDPKHFNGSVKINEISTQNAALLDLLGSRILQEKSITSLLNYPVIPDVEVRAVTSRERGTKLGNKNSFDFLVSVLDNASVRIYLKKFNESDQLKLHNIWNSQHISIGHNLFMEIGREKFKRMKNAASTILSSRINSSIISLFIGDYMGRYSYSFFKRIKSSINQIIPNADIYYSQELNIIFIVGAHEMRENIINCIRVTIAEVQETWTG